MGAYGAAILAHERNLESSSLLKKEDLDNFSFKTKSYRCRQSGTNFSDKDEQLRCAEFAMVNYDEFDRLSSSDLDNLKSLITTPDVSIRAPYGSTKERRVRIASYCASGNKFQFLTDQTGNRRFLPFYVEHIDSPFDHPIDHHRLYASTLWA